MDALEQALQVVEEAQASHHAAWQLEHAEQLREVAALLLWKASILENEALSTAYEQIGDPRRAA